MPRTESELYATEYRTLQEAAEAEFPLFWAEFGPGVIDGLTDEAQIETRKAICKLAFVNGLWVGQNTAEALVLRMMKRLADTADNEENDSIDIP